MVLIDRSERCAAVQPSTARKTVSGLQKELLDITENYVKSQQQCKVLEDQLSATINCPVPGPITLAGQRQATGERWTAKDPAALLPLSAGQQVCWSYFEFYQPDKLACKACDTPSSSFR
jgi:hypothetical protein